MDIDKQVSVVVSSICLPLKYSILKPVLHCGKLFNLLSKSHSLSLLLFVKQTAVVASRY